METIWTTSWKEPDEKDKPPRVVEYSEGGFDVKETHGEDSYSREITTVINHKKESET